MTEQTQAKKDWREHYILFMLDVEAKNGEKVYILTKQGNHASFTRETDESIYERHTCPTNFINVNAIATLSEKGEMNGDPHGIFKFISKMEIEEGDKIMAAEDPENPQMHEKERLIWAMIEKRYPVKAFDINDVPTREEIARRKAERKDGDAQAN